MNNKFFIIILSLLLLSLAFGLINDHSSNHVSLDKLNKKESIPSTRNEASDAIPPMHRSENISKTSAKIIDEDATNSDEGPLPNEAAVMSDQIETEFENDVTREEEYLNGSADEDKERQFETMKEVYQNHDLNLIYYNK